MGIVMTTYDTVDLEPAHITEASSMLAWLNLNDNVYTMIPLPFVLDMIQRSGPWKEGLGRATSKNKGRTGIRTRDLFH
jgi:hypothetical protein